MPWSRSVSVSAALLLAGACRQELTSSAQLRKDAPKAYEDLLGRVVSPDGRVDYDALEADRGPLDGYVAWLGSEKAWQGRMTKDWHAQYLNAYNALVLYQVLERGRPASVLDVRGGGLSALVPIAGYGFFHATEFALGEETLTLSEIENERIRWKELDYRDHAALNCASRSCPPLRAELYRTPALDAQLDDQMQRWVADPDRGVRIEGGTLVMSPIFDWFARDFDFFSAGLDVCTIVADHTEDPDTAEQLRALSEEGCPTSTFPYDWSLNDVSGAADGG